MTYENYIKARLVEYAVHEAYHYGGIACMLAVAQVIANRVKAGWGEWKNVLDTADNYTGTVREKRSPVDPKDLSFRLLLNMIDEVYLGTADDSNVNVTDDRGTLTALYYADISNLSPLSGEWFRANITDHIDRHPRIATVGPLSFFA